MAKKQAPKPADPGTNLPPPVVMILGAFAIVGVFAALAIAATMLVFGEPEGDTKEADLPAFTAEAPPLERSEAADLLANKSFDDMTQVERDLVAAEVTRVYDNAEFRAKSQYVFAIDVIRRDGVTRAINRYWNIKDRSGNPALRETIQFFCESEVAGFLDVFKADRTSIFSEVSGDRIAADTQAFQRTIAAMDWTQAKDLGFDEIDGRRVHGVETPWRLVAGESSSISQIWIDVENARMLRRVELNQDRVAVHNYEIDWRVPPRIVPPPELKPPCYKDIYPDA